MIRRPACHAGRQVMPESDRETNPRVGRSGSSPGSTSAWRAASRRRRMASVHQSTL